MLGCSVNPGSSILFVASTQAQNYLMERRASSRCLPYRAFLLSVASSHHRCYSGEIVDRFLGAEVSCGHRGASLPRQRETGILLTNSQRQHRTKRTCCPYAYVMITVLRVSRSSPPKNLRCRSAGPGGLWIREPCALYTKPWTLNPTPEP